MFRYFASILGRPEKITYAFENIRTITYLACELLTGTASRDRKLHCIRALYHTKKAFLAAKVQTY